MYWQFPDLVSQKCVQLTKWRDLRSTLAVLLVGLVKQAFCSSCPLHLHQAETESGGCSNVLYFSTAGT